jgi:hypothetical protein
VGITNEKDSSVPYNPIKEVRNGLHIPKNNSRF